MGFISIVQGVVADRVFLISNGGFQGGFIECAECANIILFNFEQFKESTRVFIRLEVLKRYEGTCGIFRTRYWAHSKGIRKGYDLRHDHGYMSPYNCIGHLGFIEKAIGSIRDRQYLMYVGTGLEVNAGEKMLIDFRGAYNCLNINHFKWAVAKI